MATLLEAAPQAAARSGGRAEPGTPPLSTRTTTKTRVHPYICRRLRAAARLGAPPPWDPGRGEEVLPGPDVNDADSLALDTGRNLRTRHPGKPASMHRRARGRRATICACAAIGIRGRRPVMPSAPSAEYHATVYAIAERAGNASSRHSPQPPLLPARRETGALIQTRYAI